MLHKRCLIQQRFSTVGDRKGTVGNTMYIPWERDYILWVTWVICSPRYIHACSPQYIRCSTRYDPHGMPHSVSYQYRGEHRVYTVGDVFNILWVTVSWVTRHIPWETSCIYRGCNNTYTVGNCYPRYFHDVPHSI